MKNKDKAIIRNIYTLKENFQSTNEYLDLNSKICDFKKGIEDNTLRNTTHWDIIQIMLKNTTPIVTGDPHSWYLSVSTAAGNHYNYQTIDDILKIANEHYIHSQLFHMPQSYEDLFTSNIIELATGFKTLDCLYYYINNNELNYETWHNPKGEISYQEIANCYNALFIFVEITKSYPQDFKSYEERDIDIENQFSSIVELLSPDEQKALLLVIDKIIQSQKLPPQTQKSDNEIISFLLPHAYEEERILKAEKQRCKLNTQHRLKKTLQKISNNLSTKLNQDNPCTDKIEEPLQDPKNMKAISEDIDTTNKEKKNKTDLDEIWTELESLKEEIPGQIDSGDWGKMLDVLLPSDMRVSYIKYATRENNNTTTEIQQECVEKLRKVKDDISTILAEKKYSDFAGFKKSVELRQKKQQKLKDLQELKSQVDSTQKNQQQQNINPTLKIISDYFSILLNLFKKPAISKPVIKEPLSVTNITDDTDDTSTTSLSGQKRIVIEDNVQELKKLPVNFTQEHFQLRNFDSYDEQDCQDFSESKLNLLNHQNTNYHCSINRTPQESDDDDSDDDSDDDTHTQELKKSQVNLTQENSQLLNQKQFNLSNQQNTNRYSINDTEGSDSESYGDEMIGSII